jgi:predicted DNA-binding transcriptional regulator YafY
MTDATNRRIMCLELIPVQPKRISTAELVEIVNSRKIEQGEFKREVSSRTIQRDMNALMSANFPIVYLKDERDPRKLSSSYSATEGERPGGWAYTSKHQLPVFGMDQYVALSIYMAYKYLAPVMAPAMLEHLEPYVCKAEEKLEEHRSTIVSSWRDKVRISTSVFYQQPAKVDPEVEEIIYKATLNEKMFEGYFYNKVEGTTNKHRFSPLGIIHRDKATYLITTFDGGKKIHQLPFHRFTRLSSFTAKVKVPENFNIEDYTHHREGSVEVFRALITNETAEHYIETPLDKSQVIEESDRNGWKIITATLPITLAFKYFILSYQAEVIVQEPSSMRDWMKDKIHNMHKNYS